MLDVLLSITLATTLLWGKRVLLPWTGYPLLFSSLAVAWYGHSLPHETYSYDGPFLWKDLLHLTLVTDVLQFAVHSATHSGHMPSFVVQSHRIHHLHTVPTPDTAFVTGVVDAFVQLLCPLFASFWWVRPSRRTAIAFGVCYSNWLVYLHSPLPDHGIPFLVTPSQHRQHHAHPHTHASHVLSWTSSRRTSRRGGGEREPPCVGG